MATRESVDIQLARFDEQQKHIIRSLEEARDGRKHQYEAIEAIKISLISFDNRMKSVEQGFATAAPTLEEFVRIKQRVVAAGVMGKWLWVAGGILVTLVYRLRGELVHWLPKI